MYIMVGLGKKIKRERCLASWMVGPLFSSSGRNSLNRISCFFFFFFFEKKGCRVVDLTMKILYHSTVAYNSWTVSSLEF